MHTCGTVRASPLVFSPHRLAYGQHPERPRDVTRKGRERVGPALGTHYARRCRRVVRSPPAGNDEALLALPAVEVAERAGQPAPLFSARAIVARHGSSVSVTTCRMSRVVETCWRW